MASVIVSTPKSGGGTDNSISMSNASWARPITIPSTWNKVRVGVRMWITDFGSGPTSTPYFALGLCSGTTNLIGDAQTTYFIGAITNTATWTYSGGANAVYFSINVVPCVKTGSVLTSGSNIVTDGRFSITGSGTACVFLDITKGNPNYTFNTFIYNGVGANVSALTFQQQMPLTSPVISGHAFGTDRTMAVNETLSGSLNCVSCWWNRSDLFAQIQDVAVAVLQ